jgi:ferrous iron transport protein A
MPFLDQLAIGQSGKITKLDLKTSESQRFMEMGLTVGATIKLVKVAPLGDPIEILVRGYHLSLRKNDAHLIVLDQIK